MTTEVTTKVPGNIWKVLVKEGDQVKKGDTLFIMEIMKTEVNHDSPIDGKIAKINIKNDQEDVDPGTVAIMIEQINLIMQNKFDLNTLSYLKLIKDLSVEIGISLEEAKSLVDTALHFINSKKINYQELKEEILTFLVMNMFSLICKL